MRLQYRKKTKMIRIGNRYIGGDEPIAVQSMTNTKTYDVEKTVEQIKTLEEAGCEMIRVSIPDMASAEAIPRIKKNISIPLIADIHYDHRLAIESIKKGADKIRINPGNIGGISKVREIVKIAKEYEIPIRIGINCGSLEKDIFDKHGEINKYAVLESVDRNIDMMSMLDYDELVISIKSSDIYLNKESNLLVAEKYNYPLHIGITESGSDEEGIIKSAIGLGLILDQGIGDTIRVSLSNDPVYEIRAAYQILNTMGLRSYGIEVISCPTCARTDVDIINITREFKDKTKNIKKHLKVAIMGCAVNGIGESQNADVGIAGGKNEFLLFEKGKIIKKVKEKEAVDELIKHILRIIENA